MILTDTFGQALRSAADLCSFTNPDVDRVFSFCACGCVYQFWVEKTAMWVQQPDEQYGKAVPLLSDETGAVPEIPS